MPEQFDNVVFAGGGSRCFWQLGFWDGAVRAGLRLDRSVRYAASTSAGCAICTAALLDRGPEALDLFMEMTDRNPANVHWQNLRARNGAALLPHMAMYREALTRFLQPSDLAALADRQLEFLMAIPPVYLPGGLGPLLAFPLYGLEKHLTGAVHPRWTRSLGFQPLVRGNRDVASVEELIEIILAASCVPPVLPSPGYRGRRVLDGGLIDNVPVDLTRGKTGKTLVLLSKRYRDELPQVPDRVYVQPARPIAIDKFDYASPDKLLQAYRQGEEDAQAFVGEREGRPTRDEPAVRDSAAIH